MTELGSLNTKIVLRKVIVVAGRRKFFKIKEILKTDPIMYKIVDLDNELIHGSFYSNELQKTSFKNAFN